ncbi:MAG: SCO family protein [Alphaproteobacteria bacterium]|jgi:protein SCO1/2|nr:SCO family protein [Alphaproteobacteria bacterium]MDP6590473.1 SCO family protein [Alphaproteobacteria bacterium]MDP6818917.1 SCO family protein [Alphaproteobacteria bacterium]|tara:strand:- start:959 stop:1522 length:564 start_codon:yes stop_codon:yes gene_type:complete
MRIARLAAALVLALLLAGAAPARGADIGGPFALTDHHGNSVTDQSYAGKYLLVFFGYTYCPDVCPTELLVFGQTLDLLGAKAARVQALFISVDPERDTPEKLAEYVPNFHPDLIGLTGTLEQVTDAARAYRVYFRKSPATADEEGYLVDHTSLVYLMDPAGEFARHFVFGQGAETVARQIEEMLDQD